MKVLYVEDNPANVFLVKRVARMGNHEIINYIDGGQALKKYDEINPDLVLMDIQLAGDKSGLDVVRELRARGIKTHIIAVTAYAMVGDKERCIEAGCDDYLAKPLPIPRLVEIFESHSKRVIAALASNPVPVAAPVAVAEAPKAEAAPAPLIEAPKVEIAPAPIIEAPKVEIAPAPITEAPKAEIAPAPITETPKVETAPAPITEAPKAEVAPQLAPAVEKPRTATAPLTEIPEAKAADTPELSEVKAVETPAEPKAAEDTKKEAEQTSVNPEASSN